MSLYEQIYGVAMGNTYTCSTAEKLEDKLPCKRYVNNILAALQDISTATAFLAH